MTRSTYPARVTVVEVGPRDDLQNESATLETSDKIAFVDLLTRTGVGVIEVAAFVSPRWVPRMADADDAFAGITRDQGVRYTALVPNLRGLERARAAGVEQVPVFAAASETFSLKNINHTIDESLSTYADVCVDARRTGIEVRGYLSTAFGCPFEGSVSIARVVELPRTSTTRGARHSPTFSRVSSTGSRPTTRRPAASADAPMRQVRQATWPPKS